MESADFQSLAFVRVSLEYRPYLLFLSSPATEGVPSVPSIRSEGVELVSDPPFSLGIEKGKELLFPSPIQLTPLARPSFTYQGSITKRMVLANLLLH